MTEIEEIAEETFASIPEWAQRALARSEDNTSCFVYGRFPDEGMTWRANMVEALYSAAQRLWVL